MEHFSIKLSIKSNEAARAVSADTVGRIYNGFTHVHAMSPETLGGKRFFIGRLLAMIRALQDFVWFQHTCIY